MHLMLYIYFSLVASFAQKAWSSRILLLPFPGGGHLIEAANIGYALSRKGHDVYVTRSNAIPNPKRLDGKGLKFLDYKTIIPSDPVPTESPFSLQNMARPFTESLLGQRPFFTAECLRLVHSEEINEGVKRLKFDLFIVDGLMVCYYALPYKYGIPYITMGTFVSSTLFDLNPLEYNLPCDVRANPNTILNRFKHIQNVRLFCTCPDLLIDQEMFLKNTPIHPYTSLKELVKKSKLIMFNSNHIVDCPIPKLPKIVQIGGIQIQKAKPLENEYASFYNGAKDGVIVFALGSVIDSIPDSVAYKFIEAFRGLKQRVVWRCNLEKDSKIKSNDFPENVLPRDWLPLGDMLADKRTVLLMYHGGNNGQFEAVYHGVPMITIPLFGDQPYNARRAEYKGYGLILDIHTFKPDELKSKIDKIVGNSTYTERMKQVSEFFRDDLKRSKPFDRVTTEIEKLLKYGDEHLTTSGDFLEYHQLLNWDMAVAVILGLNICFLVFCLILKALININANKSSHKKVE